MTQPLRILHLIDHLRLGGAQRALLDLILATPREEVIHEVACLHGRGVEWDAFAAAGVPLHSLSESKWNPVYLLRLAELLRSGRYDALHCHLIYSNLLGKPLAAAVGLPWRFCHDQWNDPPPTDCLWMRLADRWAHHWTTHVFAVSPFVGEYLIQEQGLPPDRVSVVPNGMDVSRFPLGRESSAEARRRHGLPETGPIIGAVARLTGQKNLFLFIRAAAEVLKEHPEATFLLAGTGEDEMALKAEAAQLGLGERCRFLGHVAEMPQLYPALDILVLPSVYEGFGLVIIEALLCGAAVVASEVVGAKGYLQEGRDAFFVSPLDEAGFVRRIQQLIESPELRASQTASAKQVIETELSSIVMARRVTEVYQRYLGK